MATPELAKLLGSVQRGQMGHYLHVASACAFAYDHLTTLGEEVELIWSAPWGLGKALFLASRYLVWPEFIFVVYLGVSNLPESRCYAGLVYLTLSIVAGVVVSQVVLTLRTWAIYDGRRTILHALGLLSLAIVGANAWIIARYFQHTRVLDIPGGVGCVVVSSSKAIATTWITVSCFEFVIVTMTVIKGIEHFRFGSSTLLVSLYRDGILYYIFLSSVSLANLVVVLSAPDEYIVLLAVLQSAFHSILACRIILNLRAVRTTPRISTIGAETVSGWFGARGSGAQALSV